MHIKHLQIVFALLSLVVPAPSVHAGGVVIFCDEAHLRAALADDGGGNLSYPDTTCPGINLNPLLYPLQDNGGPTWTMALGPGSAAIDAGDDATCAADPVNNLDQRAVARPRGAHCDIGALEQLRFWLPLLLAYN